MFFCWPCRRTLVFAGEKSDFGLSDIIFDLLSKKKNHVTNSPPGVCTWWKVSPTKTTLLSRWEVIVNKTWQKVVENDRLGERSSNPVSILRFDNSIESYLKKTDFPKIFQTTDFSNDDKSFRDWHFSKKLGFGLLRSARISQKNLNPKKMNVNYRICFVKIFLIDFGN